MSDDNNSIDITGIGKLAKAIPPTAWNKLVKTACDIFSQLVAPITETTGGLGRLIKAKFDSMLDVQKIYAADTLVRVKEKIEKSGRQPKGNPKSNILLNAIGNASNEYDDNIREIWANMIANEIINNQVHPEFPNILERLSSNDAITLASIAESNKKDTIKTATKAFIHGFRLMGVSLSALVDEETDFSREHLKNLNLTTKYSGQWRLTLTGEEFLKAVADPTFEHDIDAKNIIRTDYEDESEDLIDMPPENEAEYANGEYIGVDELLISKISEYYSDRFTRCMYGRVDDFEYDILINDSGNHNSAGIHSHIIKIKYFTMFSQESASRLKATIAELARGVGILETDLKKNWKGKAQAILFIVTPTRTLGHEKHMVRDFLSELERKGELYNVRSFIFSINKIPTLSKDQFDVFLQIL